MAISDIRNWYKTKKLIFFMWTFFPNVLPWNYPYAAFSSNSCIFNLMFCLLEILENKWRYYEDLNIIWNKEKRYKMKPSMWSTIVIHCTIVLYSNGFDNNKKKVIIHYLIWKRGLPNPHISSEFISLNLEGCEYCSMSGLFLYIDILIMISGSESLL